METLTYGRKRPQNLDRGSVFFDALRENITIDDAHNHDGINSPQLTADATSKYVVAVPGTGWTAVGDGSYKRTVTMPGSFTWGNVIIHAYGSGGAWADRKIEAKLVKVTMTTFEVRLLVNDQALNIVFS